MPASVSASSSVAPTIVSADPSNASVTVSTSAAASYVAVACISSSCSLSAALAATISTSSHPGERHRCRRWRQWCLCVLCGA